MNSDIHNIVFDFGNVLVHWDIEGAMISRYSHDLISMFRDNENSGFEDINVLCDMGKPLSECIQLMRQQHGDIWADMMQWYIDHFTDAVSGQLEGSQQLILDLKEAGYHVYGLSNWSAETFKLVWNNPQRYPTFHLLEDLIISGDVHCVKPNRNIYELALSRFGITANETAFLDDRRDNIDGALAVGMHAIQFVSPEQARTDLIQLGVNIPRLITPQDLQ